MVQVDGVMVAQNEQQGTGVASIRDDGARWRRAAARSAAARIIT